MEITGETLAGSMSLRLSLPAKPVRRDQGVVHQMAARMLIRDIEEEALNNGMRAIPGDALQLSLMFSVLCRSSAFVAVDEDGSCELPVSTDGSFGALQKKLETGQPMPSRAPTRGYPGTLSACHLRLPTAVTNSVWRSEGVRHKKNEVFLDVAEQLSISVAADGSILQSNIQGAFRVRSYLSGMPELKLGLNEKLRLARPVVGRSSSYIDGMVDARFHQCMRVRGDGSLSFIPPDGEFELMAYLVHSVSKLPVQIKTVISRAPSLTQVEYAVSLTSSLKASASVKNVEVHVPLPLEANTCADELELEVSQGSASYEQEVNAVVWRIPSIRGLSSHALTVKLRSPSAFNQRSFSIRRGPSPCINASFEVTGFACSGLNVRYLKVIEKSGYQSFQQVRYLTHCPAYLQRLPL